jgi:PAS domain S-box-containing protein
MATAPDPTGLRRRGVQSWKVGILVLVGILGLPTIGLVATVHLFRQADLRQAGATNALAATAVANEVGQSFLRRERLFRDLPDRPSLDLGLTSDNRSLLERSLRLALEDGQYCRVVLRSPGIVPVVVSGPGSCWSPPALPSDRHGVHSLGVAFLQGAAFTGWSVTGAVPAHARASLQVVFSVRSLTSAAIPGAGIHTTVVDGTTIVSSSAPGIVGRTIVVPTSVAMIRAGRPSSATVYASLIHTTVIEAYRPVAGTGLGVFFSVTTRVAYAAANHARGVLLAGYLVLLAIGFGLAGGVFVSLRRRDRARDLAATHYRSLADATPDGLAILDETSHLVYANPALLAMVGAGSPDSWLGHPLAEWLDMPDDKGVARRAPVIHEGRMLPNVRMQLRHVDGHHIPVEGNAGPFDLGGRPGMISVIRDLTSRHEAEAAIALAEARQRATIETISDGIVVYDLDGKRPPKAVLMNPAALDFIGYPLGELQGSFNWSYSVMVDADGGEVLPDQMPPTVVARTGEPHRAVMACTPPGGPQRWLRVTANPIADRHGVMVGIVTSLVDITKELADRVKAEADGARLAELVRVGLLSEQALRESEERFHLAFEHAPIGKSLISLDGHYEEANPAMCRITGYSEDQLQQRTDAALTHPADLAADVAAEETLLAGAAGNYTLEKRYRTASGADVWVSSSRSLVRHEDGSPRHFIAQVQDITERKKHEEVLALERRRLQAAQSIGHIGSWEMEIATRDLAWSDTLLELYGLGPQDAPGVLAAGMDRVHPDDRDDVQSALDACVRTGEPMWIRHRVIRANDGRLRWLEAHGEGVFEHGTMVRLAGAVVDVTEQVLAAKEAKEGRDLAVEASRQKSAFLATMSHEIRTPMNAVIGMTDLLLDTALDAEQRGFVETVRTGGDSLLVIINDILDFSKIEAGGLRLEHQPFDLRDCVDDALDLVAATPSAEGLELIVDVQEGCPAVVVGDVTRLRQVLVNLLGNAAKFTPYGEVVVRVQPDDYQVSDDDGRVGLRFAVADTGIGIHPDLLAGLFDSFNQGDASTTRIYGGTGLGLAISQRLVNAMGGAIAVESTDGEGSTFHFSIVLGRAAPPGPFAQPGSGDSLDGRSALIVDDNATSRRILRLQLEGWGVTVSEAAGGTAALAVVESGRRFDVAVVDMGMPDMTDQDLTLAWRAAPATRRLPIVLLAGRADRPPTDREDPFVLRLSKPVRAARLHQQLEAMLLPTKVAVVASPSRDEAVGLGPLRVLLAEDNSVNQRLARLMLEKLGHHIDVVSNGQEAVDAIRLAPYDAVLMDVEMPVMDGLEATRTIRRTQPPEGQPEIVAMTASALVEDREACYDAGMDDYLAKPVRLQDLRVALERAAMSRQVKKATAPTVPDTRER